MLLNEINQLMTDFTRTSPLNVAPELDGLRIFDPPLMGIATADDPMFLSLKLPAAVGPLHMLPQEWLPGAETVISYFLPFTKTVRTSNRQPGLPSKEWLYGRIEGQAFNVALSRMLVEQLKRAGNLAVCPAEDSRFAIADRRSNWSERHVAFIAGLGTISLNRSLITRLGAAGRIGSVLTDLTLPVTPRYYTKIEENCSHCGACIGRCPPQAISETGKDHAICSSYLDSTLARFTPRYGCGKCQTAVPCEMRIPLPK